MNDQFELTLANQRSEIARLQDQLESFARQHGFAARVLHDVQLALEEHLANILSHGYNDKLEHQIRVRVQLHAPELRVEVEDDGRPFNPLAHPSPDLSKPIEERPVGGLGIHMMRKSLDGLEYGRQDGKNMLVMIKRI
jgi:anti-sigma regulatory factor (Ser/Thr protein kinase)